MRGDATSMGSWVRQLTGWLTRLTVCWCWSSGLGDARMRVHPEPIRLLANQKVNTGAAAAQLTCWLTVPDLSRSYWTQAHIVCHSSW